MFTESSLIILGLGMLAIVLPHLHFGKAKRMISDRTHRAVCITVFAVGCFVRLFRLNSLPQGIFAEEALLGVQAKALWQTGGFLFDGGLTTQFAQWAGESSGPLLATITAPFVALLGMTPFAVRLPLALLSCAAIPAAYALGDALGGKRAGRWMMTAYAICPYFVLMSRMACGANAAVFLLPVAMLALVKGMKSPLWLYAGMILMGLMAYTQDMYFYIAPAAVLVGGVTARLLGMKKRYAFAAVALGMTVCLPALMTLVVNLTGREGFTWLGIVQIPRLSEFDKADALFDAFFDGNAVAVIQGKTEAVLMGTVFQLLRHMNISETMFVPSGMGALYVLSLPLMMLGGFGLLHDCFEGKKVKKEHEAGRILMTVLAAAIFLLLVLFGSAGLMDNSGVTSVFDYSAFLLFDVLLMSAGLCRLEKKSCTGISAVAVLLVVSFGFLCTHVFGGAYQEQTNVCFTGFGEMAQAADRIQEETGAKVNVTQAVYPHISPSEAAEFMYLYATDADMEEAASRRGEMVEVIYAPGIAQPDDRQIYLITQSDISEWELSGFSYDEMGEFVLLSPIE